MNSTRHLALVLGALTTLAACGGPPGEQGPQGPPGLDVVDGVLVLAQDTTWSGEVQLAGSVYVPEGVTLSLAAGAEISFLPSTELLVDGNLVSLGTAESRVVLLATATVGDAVRVEIAGPPSINSQGADASLLSEMVFEKVNLKLYGHAAGTVANVEFAGSNLEIHDRGNSEFLVRDCRFGGPAAEGTRLLAEDVTALSVDGTWISGGGAGIVHRLSSAWMPRIYFDASDLYVGELEGDGIRFSPGTSTTSEIYLTNTEVSFVAGDAIVVEGGFGAFERTESFDVGGAAIRALSGTSLQLLDVYIEQVGQGIHTEGSLLGSRVEVWEALQDGIHGGPDSALELDALRVGLTGDDCIDSEGSLTVSRIRLGLCGSDGIEAESLVEVSHAWIEDTEDRGIWARDGNIRLAEIEDTGGAGIVLDGPAASEIEAVSILEAGAEGIRGSSGINQLTVKESSIGNSASWAVRDAVAVEGCYVADNNGQEGADLMEATSGDPDLRSVSSSQMTGIATITDAQQAWLAPAIDLDW